MVQTCRDMVEESSKGPAISAKSAAKLPALSLPWLPSATAGSEGSALGRLGPFFDCYDQTVGTKPQEEYWLPRASKLWTWNAAVSCVSSSMPHSSRNQPDESGECHSLLSRTRNREGAPREMQAAASSLQHEVPLLRHPVDVVVIICACGFFNFFFYLDRWSKSCRKLSILWSYLDITLLSSYF